MLSQSRYKDNMISIVLKTYKQICNSETTSLFKSYNINYKDGEQKRDFIYVKDCVKVLIWFKLLSFLTYQFIEEFFSVKILTIAVPQLPAPKTP